MADNYLEKKMEDIIGKIFQLEFNEKAFLFETNDREGIRKEWELYEKLLNKLTEEEQRLLTEYMRWREAREREEIKNIDKLNARFTIELKPVEENYSYILPNVATNGVVFEYEVDGIYNIINNY